LVRFFAAPSDVSGGSIRLGAEDAAHIRSLRLRPDEEFIVCDGSGLDYVCRLGGAPVSSGGAGPAGRGGAGALAVIVESRPSAGEPSVSCTVFIALAKGDRLEYAVQKSVELGAHGIVLFPSARCVSIPGDTSKRTARLQRIALEAAKQSGRGRVPVVSAVDSFAGALELANVGLSLFFYEGEKEQDLGQVLRSLSGDSISGVSISLMTGPEGGFEPHEAGMARSAGMLTVSLGPRILRCETAPVAALAAVMYHTGNF